MPDDHETIASLSFEQALERARAGKLEAEYWQHVLADLRELHDGVSVLADELHTSTLCVLGLLPLVEQAGTGSIEALLDANKRGLQRLRLMQETLQRSSQLVEGRSVAMLEVAAAIAEAVGVELDRGDDEAEQ